MIHIITRFWILFHSGAWTCAKGHPPPPQNSVSSSILDYSNLNRRSQRDFGILSEIHVLVWNQNLGLIALPTATIYYLLLPVKEIDDQREIVNQNTKIDEIWGQNATWITRAVKHASVKRRLEREREREREKDDKDLKQHFTCEGCWPLEIELKLFFIEEAFGKFIVINIV